MHSLPIYLFADPIFRQLLKFNVSRQYMTKTILRLIEIFEEKIRNEKKATNGCLWKIDGVQMRLNFYESSLSVIVKWNIKVTELFVLQESWWYHWFQWARLQNQISRILKNQTIMVMQPILVQQHISDSWNMYSKFPHWRLQMSVCQVADNTNVNLKIVALIEIEHVGCLSHKLNLYIHDMTSRDLLNQHLTLCRNYERLPNKAPKRSSF